MIVSAVQCRVGVGEAFKSAERLIERGLNEGVEIFLLPEYFSYKVGDTSLETSKKTLEWLKEKSKEYQVILAGNIIRGDNDGYYNTLYVFEKGELVATQDKLHPTRSERDLGIKCGKKLEIFEIKGVKFAALICADILYPELCRLAALKGAEIVLNPVVSFKRSELPSQRLRHCLYFSRAFDNAYAIVKAGGVGFTFLGEECVGRSLIVSHEGILASYENENEEALISARIDLEKIRIYKRINYSLSDRNVDVLGDLLKGGMDC